MRLNLLNLGSIEVFLLVCALSYLVSCNSSNSLKVEENAPSNRIEYIGSSTIAHFIEDASKVYKPATITVDTNLESMGAKDLMLADESIDLIGYAKQAPPELAELGIRSTMIGTDALTVIVNKTNPITNLSLSQLKGIYMHKFTNWKELGGPDLKIVPLIVSQQSATQHTFKQRVLGDTEYYTECKIVNPDSHMPMNVEEEPGAIGMISHSFLCSSGAQVRVLRVNGYSPSPLEQNYPILRPLYLLWRPQNKNVAQFISWTKTEEARKLIENCFRPVDN